MASTFQRGQGSPEHRQAELGLPRDVALEPLSIQVTVVDRFSPSDPPLTWEAVAADAAPVLASFLADNRRTPCLAADLHGAILLCNAAMAELLGLEPGHPCGALLWRYLAPGEDQKIRTSLEDRARPRDARLVLAFRTREGDPVRLSCAVDRQGERFVLVGEPLLRERTTEKLWELNNELAVVSRKYMQKSKRLSEAKMQLDALVQRLQREKDEASQQAREALRGLAARLQLAREEERKKNARDIHDELGQALTALKFELRWLDQRCGDASDGVRDKLRQIDAQVDGIIRTTQRIASELRPAVLDYIGLEAAIKWQIREFHNRTGIACDLKMPPTLPRLDDQRSTAIFRILQELLTNVARHAEASAVFVSVALEALGLRLEVKDNGRGISQDESQHVHAIGIQSMQERAMVFGGEVVLHGAPGAGTLASVLIPLETSGGSQ